MGANSGKEENEKDLDRKRRELNLKKKKFAVSNEILSSERVYSNDLRTCVSLYLTPLLMKAYDYEKAKKKSFFVEKKIMKITEEHHRKIFSNLEQISDFHEVLLENIKPEDETGVSLTLKFIRYINSNMQKLFDLYCLYIKEFDSSKEILEKLLKTDSKFSDFLKTRQIQHEGERTLDLSSYLIMPIQRLPRYEMLFSQFLKVSSSSVERNIGEEKEINEVLILLKSIVRQINTEKLQHDVLPRLRSIEDELKKKTEKNLGGRKSNADQKYLKKIKIEGKDVIKEKKLHLKSSSSKTPSEFKEQIVYLLKDSIVWMSLKEKVKGMLSLKHVDVYPGDITISKDPVLTPRENKSTDINVNVKQGNFDNDCIYRFSLFGLEQTEKKTQTLVFGFKNEQLLNEWKICVEEISNKFKKPPPRAVCIIT